MRREVGKLLIKGGKQVAEIRCRAVHLLCAKR
jgi:hypothetical protein